MLVYGLENIIRANKASLARAPSIKPLRGGSFVSGFGIRNDPFTGAIIKNMLENWSTPLYSPVIAFWRCFFIFCCPTAF